MANEPDPHGQAALMLCEGLAHLLIEGGMVTKEQLVAAIDGIIDVKREIAGTREPVAIATVSVLLLQAISRSVSAASESKDPVMAKVT